MAFENWENNVLGFVAPDVWLNVPFNITRPNDPIDGLFGDEKTDNLFARWQSIADEYKTPLTAQFHAFDTEARTAVRVPVDTHNIEKGLIKLKLNQSERMRALLGRGVNGDEQLYQYVLNDGMNLADGVVTRSKIAKNELMASGKVTIKENNVDLTVDYDVPSSQTSFTLDLASDADVPGQIQTIIDTALDKGTIITGMLTSRKNVTKMRNNAAIQKAINGTYGAGATVRRSDFDAYMEEEYGIGRVVTNDLMYRIDTGKLDSKKRPTFETKRYFPEDKVTFFATTSSDHLGVGLWGDSPDADAGRFASVGGSSVSPYVYVKQWMEDDPAVLWTMASALFMPVLYSPSSLWIATVSSST